MGEREFQNFDILLLYNMVCRMWGGGKYNWYLPWNNHTWKTLLINYELVTLWEFNQKPIIPTDVCHVQPVTTLCKMFLHLTLCRYILFACTKQFHQWKLGVYGVFLNNNIHSYTWDEWCQSLVVGIVDL